MGKQIWSCSSTPELTRNPLQLGESAGDNNINVMLGEQWKTMLCTVLKDCKGFKAVGRSIQREGQL